ncbi:MAG TPA: copper resistance CopC family protein [Stellaceae bacterium]|nr:copper resistance CopC family protein [Stellaceae bacterium]
MRYAILVIMALLIGAHEARAHAFLDHANPAVGSSLHSPPAMVSLWFTQELEPAFSTVEVTDEAGARVDGGDAAVDASDQTLLHASLKKLAPGTYHVNWRVISVDTHPTEGRFNFEVER